jgi:hypothetical protein
MDSAELKSTKNMLMDLYDPLERKSVVLVNKFFPETRISMDESSRTMVAEIENMLKHPVIGVIPCFCDVLQQERSAIMALEKPSHKFVRNLEEIADKLIRIESTL